LPNPVVEPLPALPRWQSHKIVRADRIVDVITIPQGDAPPVVRWRLAGGVVVEVSDHLLTRVPPTTYSANAGYYVLYDDGYESWSPAGTFEMGYTRLSEDNYETVLGKP
jgi:hypothetical protein